MKQPNLDVPPVGAPSFWTKSLVLQSEPTANCSSLSLSQLTPASYLLLGGHGTTCTWTTWHPCPTTRHSRATNPRFVRTAPPRLTTPASQSCGDLASFSFFLKRLLACWYRGADQATDATTAVCRAGSSNLSRARPWSIANRVRRMREDRRRVGHTIHLLGSARQGSERHPCGHTESAVGYRFPNSPEPAVVEYPRQRHVIRGSETSFSALSMEQARVISAASWETYDDPCRPCCP